MSPPYAYREPPAKMSATTMISMSLCEARCAYERLLEDVPTVETPLPFIFGRVIHVFNERLWQTPKEKAEGTKEYGMKFLADVLRGEHSAESESKKRPIESIQWLTRRESERLSQAEIRDRIAEEKQHAMAKGRLALETLYLERIAPFPYTETEVERDIGKENIVIKDHHAWIGYQLSGRMDRIHHFADGSYDILDVKTGKARRTYNRERLLEDVQMTVYHKAGYTIFGKDPRQMFLVAVGDATPEILAHAREEVEAGRIPEALNKIRIPVPLRKPVHFTDLAKLAADIHTMTRMVIFPERYEPWQFQEWEPLSDWGKKADLKDNIRERRFVPRIGEAWCEYCPYFGLCQEDNAEDWKKHYQSLSVSGVTAVPVDAVAPRPARAEEPQASLFETLPRPTPLRKSDRELKREMRASNQFFPERRIPPLVEKTHKLLPPKNGVLCPCRRLNLRPRWLLRHLISLLGGEISIFTAAMECPLAECPYRAASRKPTEAAKGEVA